MINSKYPCSDPHTFSLVLISKPSSILRNLLLSNFEKLKCKVKGVFTNNNWKKDCPKLTKWFEDSIRSSLGYQELAQSFWTTYLRSTGNYNDEQLKDTKKVNSILRSKDFETLLLNNQYIKWFKIKTTVETPDPGKIDPITKKKSDRRYEITIGIDL